MKHLTVGLMHSFYGVALFTGAALLPASAFGDDNGFTGPMVFLDYEWSGAGGGGSAAYTMHKDSDAHGYNDEDGYWWFDGGDSSPMWDMDWSVAATNGSAASSSNSEFVNANLTITNNSDQPQIFASLVTFALPTQFVGGTLMNGSVTAVVSDNFGDGALLTNAGTDPIYRAYIDESPWSGSPVQSLFGPGFSLSAPPFGSNNDGAFFGEPNPIPGPEALTTISVFLKFELSAFDSASVLGHFQITQLPAPGALPLLAGLGLALGGRRRRD